MMIRLLSTLALSSLALGTALADQDMIITRPTPAPVAPCTTAAPSEFTTQYLTYETRSVLLSCESENLLVCSSSQTFPPEGCDIYKLCPCIGKEIPYSEHAIKLLGPWCKRQIQQIPTPEGQQQQEQEQGEVPVERTPEPEPEPEPEPAAETTPEIPTETTTEPTTEVPTDPPTEVPTPTPTSPTEVLVDIQVPVLHSTPFTPKMILYNPYPKSKTLFARDTSGALYYTSSISNSTAGFIAIPPCPSSRNDPRPPSQQIYPEPAWDVHYITNRLVYTCMEWHELEEEEAIVPQSVPRITTTSTLNIYNVTTRQITSYNLTEYCDLLKSTFITIDQTKKDNHIYITCTSPAAPTSCTNIWRFSHIDGIFTLAVDALECPNPRDVSVSNGRIIASCYDPDVINEQSGVRGFGWVTKIDFTRFEQIVPITSSACSNPSQIYYIGGRYVYTHCEDTGTIIKINLDSFNWEDHVYENRTVFNSSTHCPPSTSLTSFHIHSGLHIDTLYATCTDIRFTNPTYDPSIDTRVTTVIVRSRLQYQDEGRNGIETNDVRTFKLDSTCIPNYQTTHYNIAQDQTLNMDQDENDQHESSDGVLFVVCRGSDYRNYQSDGIITLYHDPARTIPMKVGTSARSAHVPNSNSKSGEIKGITTTDVIIVPSSSTSSSSSSSSNKQIMGMSVGAGVSVIIFAIIVPIITLMVIIAIYMRRRKSHVRSINNRMEPAITPNPALTGAVDAQV